MGLLPRMVARPGAPLRHVGLALASVALMFAAHPAAADSHHGGWHGGGHGGFHGGFHGPLHHFHSFVFFGGAGLGYPYYYPAYGYSPYPPPPPVYVSPTECYQPPVPRAPGVADLYTCGGQYVGPIAVP